MLRWPSPASRVHRLGRCSRTLDVTLQSRQHPLERALICALEDLAGMLPGLLTDGFKGRVDRILGVRVHVVEIRLA